MLYRFPARFYRTQPSPCAPSGNGQDLSAEDVKGLKILYPAEQHESAAVVGRKERMLEALSSAGTEEGLEMMAAEAPPFAAATANILRANLKK